jgi:uncharacterized protein YjbI with pentapeptide repeats
VVLFFILVVLVLLGGYLFHWDWTGITSQENKITTISTPRGTYKATEVQSEKNLWDWLGLLAVLAIPVAVGFGVAWFTRTQQLRDQKAAEQQVELERELTRDNQREAALQAYIDKMSELLLDKVTPLGKSDSPDEVRKIARVRTVTVLPRLDGVRKMSVLRFLHESRLIDEDKSIVDLEGANLRGADLGDVRPEDNYLLALIGVTPTSATPVKEEPQGFWATVGEFIKAMSTDARFVPEAFRVFAIKANLRRADLSHANLVGIILTYANLNQTNLSYANLMRANLMRANLYRAFLTGADLTGAYLIDADLREADLNNGKLQGADLSDAHLSGANLKGTNYNMKPMQLKDTHGNPLTLEPTQWPQEFDPKTEGAICVDC